MSPASRDLAAGLLTGSVLVLAMAIALAIRPVPELVVGVALGMSLTLAGAYLYPEIRDRLPRAAAESGGR